MVRQYNQVVGEICGYLSALGEQFTLSVDSTGDRVIQTLDRGVSIACHKDEDFFRVFAKDQISTLEGCDLRDSVPYVDVEDDLQEMEMEVDSRLNVVELINTPEDDPVEYLDGVQTSCPVFVYEPAFSIDSLHERLSLVDQTGREVFADIIDEFGIELSAGEKSVEEGRERSGPSSFH